MESEKIKILFHSMLTVFKIKHKICQIMSLNELKVQLKGHDVFCFSNISKRCTKTCMELKDGEVWQPNLRDLGDFRFHF
jgi:hypothetical protein